MTRSLLSRYASLRVAARRRIGSSLRSTLDATDLVQSVLGDALAASDQDALESTRALGVRLQRKVIDKLRRLRNVKHLSNVGQLPSQCRLEGQLDLEEQRLHISAGMDRLTAEERRCLELYTADFTWGAIAGETGLSVHQVGRRISSALKRLRAATTKVQ